VRRRWSEEEVQARSEQVRRRRSERGDGARWSEEEVRARSERVRRRRSEAEERVRRRWSKVEEQASEEMERARRYKRGGGGTRWRSKRGYRSR